MILAALNPLILLHVPILFFVFAFGCCAGSFINVIVFRMPRGMSIVTPPSRCPACQTRLTWKENFPVLGWLWLRGKCRFCKGPISVEYPAVELFVGLLLAGCYVFYFITADSGGWVGARAPDWASLGHTSIVQVWPMFAAHALLLAGLVAMTLVDARHYIIPLSIPWALTGVGIVASILQPLTHRRIVPFVGYENPGNWAVVPTVTWTGFAVVVAGCLGLGLAILFVETRLLRRSFADYDDWEKAERQRLAEEKAKAGGDDPSVLAADPESAEAPVDDTDDDGFDLTAYPHARREMLYEILFLAPALALMMIAYQVGTNLGWTGQPHPVLMGLGGGLDGLPRGRRGRLGRADPRLARFQQGSHGPGRCAPDGGGGGHPRLGRSHARLFLRRPPSSASLMPCSRWGPAGSSAPCASPFPTARSSPWACCSSCSSSRSTSGSSPGC